MDIGNENFSYTVRSGDTLYLLAKRYSTTVDAIKSLNGLTSDVLLIDEVLQIPGCSVIHIVQSGDTLYLLARKYGATVSSIMQINNLTCNNLSIGQVLIIPSTT